MPRSTPARRRVARPAPPALRVHSLAQAEAALGAALATGRRVRLLLGVYLGWAACAALRDLAEANVPGAPAEWCFDPGPRAGAAALALRQGAPAVLWPASDRRRPALSALARTTGGRLLAPPRRVLDLADLRDPLAAVQDYLSSKPRRPALPAAKRAR